MADGRPCTVHLLDGSTISVKIKPSLLGAELLSLVASRFALHEKEYFGLAWREEETTLHRWLDVKARVLDQGLPKGDIKLFFLIKFFTRDVATLKELTTQRLFFQAALRKVKEGVLRFTLEQTFMLAALTLQAIEGDFISESATRHHIDAMKLIPDWIIMTGSSLELIARKVSDEYRMLTSMDEGACILGFMGVVQQHSTYGVHYYDVKDKNGLPWRLGISLDGVAEFFQDSATPRATVAWTRLANVSFEGRKLVLTCSDDFDDEGSGKGKASRARSSTTHHIWNTSTPAFAKAVLEMVQAQHTFYMNMLSKAAQQPVALQAGIQRRTVRAASVSSRTPPGGPRPSDASSVGSASRLRLNSAVSTVSTVSPAQPRALGSLAFGASVISMDSPRPSPRAAYGDEDAHANLDRLVKRRDQLVAELRRKEKILERLKLYEREFLIGLKKQVESAPPSEVADDSGSDSSTAASPHPSRGHVHEHEHEQGLEGAGAGGGGVGAHGVSGGGAEAAAANGAGILEAVDANEATTPTPTPTRVTAAAAVDTVPVVGNGGLEGSHGHQSSGREEIGIAAAGVKAASSKLTEGHTRDALHTNGGGAGLTAGATAAGEAVAEHARDLHGDATQGLIGTASSISTPLASIAKSIPTAAASAAGAASAALPLSERTQWSEGSDPASPVVLEGGDLAHRGAGSLDAAASKAAGHVDASLSSVPYLHPSDHARGLPASFSAEPEAGAGEGVLSGAAARDLFNESSTSTSRHVNLSDALANAIDLGSAQLLAGTHVGELRSHRDLDTMPEGAAAAAAPGDGGESHDNSNHQHAPDLSSPPRPGMPGRNQSLVSVFSLDSSIVDDSGHFVAASVGDLDEDELNGQNCGIMMDFDEPGLGQERHLYLGAQV